MHRLFEYHPDRTVEYLRRGQSVARGDRLQNGVPLGAKGRALSARNVRAGILGHHGLHACQNRVVAEENLPGNWLNNPAMGILTAKGGTPGFRNKPDSGGPS